MTPDEQVQAFANDLANLVARYAQEFQAPLSGIIGVLEIQKFCILKAELNKDKDKS